MDPLFGWMLLGARWAGLALSFEAAGVEPTQRRVAKQRETPRIGEMHGGIAFKAGA